MNWKMLTYRLIAGFIFFGLLFAYLNNASPYENDASLNISSILIASFLITMFTFYVLQFVLSLFIDDNLTNKFSIIGSFIVIQILLIISGNTINLTFIGFIIIFNALIAWYAVKAL